MENFRIKDEIWLNWISDLSEIISSMNTREYIKPRYEYLLYMILDWYIKCNEDDEEMLFFRMDPKLKSYIEENEEIDDETKAYILSTIEDIRRYDELIFYDHDFIPDNIATILQIYLENEKLFKLYFADINLKDYYELMPKDLQELYDEKNKEVSSSISNEQCVLEALIASCERLQANSLYSDASEDQRNDYIRDILDAKFEVRDQTRQGTSSNGKASGELDIFIRINKLPVAVFEGMNLTSVAKKYISEHIDKIFKYDTIGNNCNFLVSYVKTKDFSSFWKRYCLYVSRYTYPYNMIKFSIPTQMQYSELKIAVFLLERNGVITRLYHMCIHIL